jgi:outer membrane protein
MKPLMALLVATILLTTALTAESASSEPLTLDDCIELALKNRASIIAARGSEVMATADKRAALGAFLPQVSASYSYSDSKSRDVKSEVEVPTVAGFYMDTISFVDLRSGETVNYSLPRDSISGYRIVEQELGDQDRTGKSLSFDASMSLFRLSNFFNYASARAQREQARLDVMASEQDLIYSVKAVFYAYLASMENLEVQLDAVKRSEEQLKLIQSKFDLGSASRSDLLKQKVQYGNDQLNLLTAENSVVTSRALLAYTVGIDPASDAEFSTEYLERRYDTSLEEAIAFGMAHQPGLLAAEKYFDASRQSVRARQSEYLPSVIGYANLGYTSGTRGDTVTFDFSERSTTVGFRVNWNIFDGFSRERNLSYAKVARNNARAQLSDMRNLVSRDIKTAFLEIRQLEKKQQVTSENVEAAQEDLRITQERYTLGAATILDLLDAQVSLRQAQVASIQADFDLNLAVAKLENAMGKM